MTCIRKTARRACRGTRVRTGRALNRASVRTLPGYCRRPDDLSSALTAFRRAMGCHRRLARLAPQFFDSAVVDREALERVELRRWMASWEPAFEKVYGPQAASTRRSDPRLELPPLPGPRTRRVVERELAELSSWLALGKLALTREATRHPHALHSLSRITRLLKVGVALGRLACGFPHGGPVVPPSPPGGPNFEADLRRIFGGDSERTGTRAEIGQAPAHDGASRNSPDLISSSGPA